MASLALAFDILARDRGASRAFDKVGDAADRAGKKGDSFGSKMKGALGGLAKAGLIGAAGAAATGIGALGVALVNGVKDAASYQTLSAKTAAVLKSTGNASHQSIKGIQARAAALESMSGVDEEVIINGQNVLATFTKVRDGVGKGNKIFDQATKAALNMSTALGTDMKGASIQVGKALNDPVKGITALGRAGVSFTKQQKDQIKALVESGDTLGAQKIILGELNKEFGGAAKAAGSGFQGAMARAKDAVQDAFRAIGEKLLPIITKVADYIAKHAGPWIDRLSKKLGGIGAALEVFFSFLAGNDTGVDGPFRQMAVAGEFLHKVLRVVADVIFTKVVPAVQAFGGWLKNDLWPALKEAYQTIMPALKDALATIGEAFGGSSKDGGGFMETLKTIGHILTDSVIPIIAQVIKVWLPLWANQIRIMIDVVQALWKVFKTLMGIVSEVVSFVLKRFADLAGMAAKVFDALSHVPGFGWAKDAANKMHAAAGKADDLARAIDNIQRDVTIGVSFKATSGRIKVNGQWVNVAAKAGGGPVRAGGMYAVGDNPDGSWNPTTELFVPKTAGTIYNQKQLASMSGGTGGRVDFSEATLQRLAALLSQVRTNATVSVGSMDAAMGGALR